MSIDHRKTTTGATLLAGLLLLAACEGPAGPQGSAGSPGADGTACWDLNGNGVGDLDSEDLDGDGVVDLVDCSGLDGDDGDDGQDGDDWSIPSFVGADVCAVCHEVEYDAWLRSGHAWALAAIDGDPDGQPWDDLGSFGDYPLNPPADTTWDDISLVLGGWAWKQVYIDQDGYLVTGAATRYNIDDGSWSPLMEGSPAGTESSFDCVSCHTTGFRPVEVDEAVPGLPASWDAAGIDCEGCHGNGTHHAESPYDAPMPIERDAEFCGGCHTSGDERLIPGADGFVEHASQYNQFASSKHRALDCVDCHDPHRSAIYDDDEFNPDTGIVASCEGCHFQEQAHANTDFMGAFGCQYCHMPPMVKAALGDEATFTGDQSAHIFAINTDLDAPQFDDDGNVKPYITLNYACRYCHVPGGGGAGGDKTDEQIVQSAVGYHQPQE